MKKISCLLRGYVKILIRDGQLERFLNLCMAHGIIIWSLEGNREEGVTFCVPLRHFYLLPDIRRKTGVQIHILEKHGLPFFFARSRKRTAFFVGIIFCGLLLYFLSGRIWNIHIEGNIKNTTPEILKFLDEKGIYHGIPKASLSCSVIASQIRENYPETAWVSARIQGSRLIVTIKEGDYQTKTETEEKKPCSIAATEAGTIVKMVTRSGVPLVQPGDVCKKEDILVLGRLELRNDSQEIFRYEYVPADADIYIKRKLAYYAELPMEYEKNVPVGKEKFGGYLKLGPLYLEWNGKKQKRSFQVVEERPFYLTENFLLPFSVGKITVNSYEKKKFSRTEEEAKALSVHILQEYEQNLMEKGVQISANNVKIEVDHQNCVSRGNLEIIEKIGKEVPVERLEQPVPESERTTENG